MLAIELNDLRVGRKRQLEYLRFAFGQKRDDSQSRLDRGKPARHGSAGGW
jgi:hypothetical protein